MHVRVLFLFLAILGYAPAESVAHFVVLPGAAAKTAIASQGTWIATQADIVDAETRISQIAGLKAKNWRSDIHIDHPERYFRQYVPVRYANRALIYLNAFCVDPPPSYWRERLVIVDDGATCFWQAFYDPEKKLYSDLTINSRG
jgi:hypothetical protein